MKGTKHILDVIMNSNFLNEENDFAPVMYEWCENHNLNLSEILNEDKELNDDLLRYINEMGYNFDKICIRIVGVAQYYLDRIKPNNRPVDFNDYWIDQFDYDEEMMEIVDAALERARNKLEKEEMKIEE